VKKAINGFKKSKTIKFAWAKVALGAVGLAIENQGMLQGVIDPVYFYFLIIGLGVADHFLRTITTHPLDEK